MTSPRLDPVLTLIDRLLAVRDYVATTVHGPRCPVCWSRCRSLDAHLSTGHQPGEKRAPMSEVITDTFVGSRHPAYARGSGS